MPSTTQRAAPSGASHFRLRHQGRTRLAGLAAAFVLSGCGGGEGGPSGPARPTFTIDGTSAAPMGIVVGTVSGRALPVTGLRAHVGTDTAIVRRFDDSTVALVVPVVGAPGVQPVTLTFGADTLTTTLTVTAAAPVADPAAYATTALDGVASAMSALETELTALDPAAHDTAGLRADIARARSMLDSARTRLATATPAERAAAAQFLAANAEAFGLSSAPAPSSVMFLQAPDGVRREDQPGLPKCFSAETGAGLYTWEECGKSQEIFSRYTRRKVAILAVGSAAAVLLDLSGLGTALGLIGGAVIVKEVVRLGVATSKTLAQTTVAKFEEQLDLAAIRAQVATTAPEPEYFVKDRGRALRVRATYRSMQESDAMAPGLGRRVSLARGLESIFATVRSALQLSALRPLVPATARFSRVDFVPTAYLSLASVGSSITGTATAADSGLVVRFARAGLASDLPFTFELAYTATGLPTQERDVSAVLIPTPRFIAKSLIEGALASSMCAYDVQDVLYCWGNNQFGKLGDLTRVQRPRPVRSVTAAGLRSVSLGMYHGCGLTAAGSAQCWGYGALGDSAFAASALSNEGRLAARPVDFGHVYSTLVSGGAETCGLRAGIPYCWGEIVGTMDTTGSGRRFRNENFPNRVPFAPTLATLDVGGEFACGVSPTQGLWCWGRNNTGQSGVVYTYFNESRPVQVGAGLAWASVSTGNGHACALTIAGKAYCWGANQFGQVGNNTGGNSLTADVVYTPAAVSGTLTFAALAVGGDHSCALTADGTAHCWGANGSSQADGNGIEMAIKVPVAVRTSVKFKQLVAGGSTTCGIAKVGGAVYCWGSNHEGAAGIGAATNNEPVSTVMDPAN